MDWNKVGGLTNLGNFLLGIVVIVLMVVYRPTDQQAISQVSTNMTTWILPSVLGLIILTAAILNVKAASMSRKMSAPVTKQDGTACKDRWPHMIAGDQAHDIAYYVGADGCGFQLHELLRDDPYVEFDLYIYNNSIYDVTFNSLAGSVLFADRLLSGLIRWTEEPLEISHTSRGTLTIQQSLTKADAEYILTTAGENARFDFSRLKIMIKGTDRFEHVEPKRLPIDTSLGNEHLLQAYGSHTQQPVDKPVSLPSSSPQYAKFKPITEPEPRGADVPRSYTEDRFGTGPMWQWRYSEVAGDLTPLHIEPHCPQCNQAMMILSREIKDVRENGDHLYHVKMQCKNHPNDIYGDLGNFDGSDYPEVRSLILNTLQYGGWQEAIRKYGH